MGNAIHFVFLQTIISNDSGMHNTFIFLQILIFNVNGRSNIFIFLQKFNYL
jgi:hypothetical protein